MPTLTALLAVALVRAAPLTNNTTAPQSESWFVSPPKGRGTVDLLTTCLVTLTICVWSAIHPNIISNPTISRRLRYKALYVVLGIFAPEIVLAIAFNEWRDSKKVLRQWVYSAENIRDEASEILENPGIYYEEDEMAAALSELRDARAKSRSVKRDEGTLIAAGGMWGVQDTLQVALASAESVEGFENSLAAAKSIREAERVRIAIQKYKAIGRTMAAGEKSSIHEFLRRGIERVRRTWLWEFFVPETGDEDIFGMESAFFAVMGGYTFCPADEYSNPVYERTLSASGLELLLRTGIIDPLKLAMLKEAIVDKGKADMLGKLLVCMQALWMMINCLCRKAAGLPITIIELNVIVHVICAVSVYLCWWKKPHDAGRPISLSPIIIKEPICSLVFAVGCSGVVLNASEKIPGPQIPFEVERDRLPVSIDLDNWTATEQAEAPSSPTPPGEIASTESASDSTKVVPLGPTPKASTAELHSLEICQVYVDTPRDNEKKFRKIVSNHSWMPAAVQPRLEPNLHIALKKSRALVDRKGGFYIEAEEDTVLTEQDLLVYFNAANAMRSNIYPPIISRSKGLYQLEVIRSSITSITGDFHLGQITLSLVPLCLIYGGIHCSLWNTYFPTPTERLLWRISCVLIGFPGICIMSIREIKALISPAKSSKDPKTTIEYTTSPWEILREFIFHVRFFSCLGIAGGSIYGAVLGFKRLPGNGPSLNSFLKALIIIGVALAVKISVWGAMHSFSVIKTSYRYSHGLQLIPILLAAAYFAARVFVFVETFICLRSLPSGAYETVPWDTYLPHL